jgi:hypothetical protein
VHDERAPVDAGWVTHINCESAVDIDDLICRLCGCGNDEQRNRNKVSAHRILSDIAQQQNRSISPVTADSYRPLIAMATIGRDATKTCVSATKDLGIYRTAKSIGQ